MIKIGNIVFIDNDTIKNHCIGDLEDVMFVSCEERLLREVIATESEAEHKFLMEVFKYLWNAQFFNDVVVIHRYVAVEGDYDKEKDFFPRRMPKIREVMKSVMRHRMLFAEGFNSFAYLPLFDTVEYDSYNDVFKVRLPKKVVDCLEKEFKEIKRNTLPIIDFAFRCGSKDLAGFYELLLRANDHGEAWVHHEVLEDFIDEEYKNIAQVKAQIKRRCSYALNYALEKTHRKYQFTDACENYLKITAIELEHPDPIPYEVEFQ